ncbi:MAG: hypothetical protein JSV34_04940, partial [Candidatus Omnitrophota bacterium]
VKSYFVFLYFCGREKGRYKMRYFIIILTIFLVFHPTSIFAQKETLEIKTVFGKPGVYPEETKLATESGGVSVGYSEAEVLIVPEDVLIVKDKIGIGKISPDNQLDAAGNAVIGKGYVDSSIVAPTNGLIVEGNVGIGTTAASAVLDVHGEISSAADNLSVSGINFEPELTAGNNFSNLIALRINPTFDSASYTNVKHHGLIVESGKVAMGIGNAFGDFHLHDKSGDVIQYITTKENTAAIHIGVNYGEAGVKYGTIGLDVNGKLHLGGNTGTPGTDQLVIDDGKVGIGTTGPSTELEVNGAIKANSISVKNIAKGKTVNTAGWDKNKHPDDKENAVDSDEDTVTTWGTTSSEAGTLEVDLGAVYRGIAYIKFAGRILTGTDVIGEWSVYSKISDVAIWTTTIWSTGEIGLTPNIARIWYVAVPFWGQIVGVKTSPPIQGAPQLRVYEIYVSPYDVEP